MYYDAAAPVIGRGSVITPGLLQKGTNMSRLLGALIGSVIGCGISMVKHVLEDHVQGHVQKHQRVIRNQQEFVDRMRERSENVANDYAEPLARTAIRFSEDRMRQAQRNPAKSWLNDFF